MFFNSLIFKSLLELIRLFGKYYNFSFILPNTFNFILLVINKIVIFYNESFFCNKINRFFTTLKKYILNSLIFRLLKREYFNNSYLENSIFYKLTDFIFNTSSKFIEKIYIKYENIFINSILFKWLITTLLYKFEILLCIFVLIINIIPDKKWYNIYGTLSVLILLSLFFIKTIVGKNVKFNIKGIDSALILFMLAILLSFLTSLFPSLSLRFFIFYATCFLLVLLIIFELESEKSLGTFIEFILLGIALTGFYGMWQYLTKSIPFDPSLTDPMLNQGMPGRIMSTMGNPNNFAELLVLTIPFYFATIFNSKSILKKILFCVLVMFPLMSLFLTGSRSAWISFAFSICVFVFFKKRKLLPWLILLGILFIPFLPQHIYRRIITLFDSSDSSAKYRVLIFEAYWPVFKEFWITGLGLGTDVFMKIVGGKLNGSYASLLNKIPVHTHNLFTQIWIETGITGVYTFLWLILRIIKNSIININKETNKFLNNILIAGVSSIGGIFIISMAEYIWYYPRVMLMFWIIIGIILSALLISSKKEKNIGGAYENSNTI